MSFLKYYLNVCKNKIQKDSSQYRLVKKLEPVWFHLVKRKKIFFYNFFQSKKKNKGIYIWGNVGVGKTFIMDLFYESLPFSTKRRFHYNRFIQKIHKELISIEKNKNTIERVIQKICKNILLFCFDEFFLNDISDTFFLEKLFKFLFRKNIYFILTSNIKPNFLYKGGIQKEKILPIITEINKNMHVIQIKNTIDYRTSKNSLKIKKTKFQERYMYKYFLNLEKEFTKNIPLIISGRKIKTLRIGKISVWFDFFDICILPTNLYDYIEISNRFTNIFISNIPKMKDDMNDCARRFITLVDEMYNSKNNLFISTMVSINDMYVGNDLSFEFQRTTSRLIEMQAKKIFTLK